jgi:Uma2 family endonuclease
VAEVLSDSTAAYDRGGKFAAYRQLPSLREVLFIDVSRRVVDLYRRGDDGLWVLHPLQAGDTMVLSSLGLRVPVDRIFDDLEGDGLEGEAPAPVAA